jgi:3,4-dihydroxy 2-butanone 4-phosphate synthase / GTP cyclohydrolase II
MHRLSKAINRLKSGRPIILIDDESRENEGNFVLPAEFATGEQIHFMTVHTRGLICLAFDQSLAELLSLRPTFREDSTKLDSASNVSMENRTGATVGISALDQARTIQAAVVGTATAADIISVGHVPPLVSVPGGVLNRKGHTEGSVDLMKSAGLHPAAVICKIIRDDGETAGRGNLKVFSEQHDIPILTIADIVTFRISRETLVDEIASACLPSAYSASAFEVRAYRSRLDAREHLALLKPPFRGTPLVRLHSECLTGDVLGSLRCDCGQQLRTAIRLIGDSECGAIIYLTGHEGRGIGLANKIRAYALQDQGMDTVDANAALGFADDCRDYGIAAQILKAMGLTSIRLLSNNPRKAAALRRYGVEVAEEVALCLPANAHNVSYLQTKRDKLGHRLSCGTAFENHSDRTGI